MAIIRSSVASSIQDMINGVQQQKSSSRRFKLFANAIINRAVEQSKEYTDTSVSAMATGLFTMKGTVTSYLNLPMPSNIPTAAQLNHVTKDPSEVQPGHVYVVSVEVPVNVLDDQSPYTAEEISTKKFPAGTSYVLVMGEAAANGSVSYHWDPMGGSFDLSIYATSEFVNSENAKFRTGSDTTGTVNNAKYANGCAYAVYATDSITRVENADGSLSWTVGTSDNTPIRSTYARKDGVVFTGVVDLYGNALTPVSYNNTTTGTRTPIVYYGNTATDSDNKIKYGFFNIKAPATATYTGVGLYGGSSSDVKACMYINPSTSVASSTFTIASSYVTNPTLFNISLKAAVSIASTLDVNNNLTVNGTASVNGVDVTSDRAHKKNITPLDYKHIKLDNIDPYTYVYRSDASERIRVGLIAQDVQNVLPEAVTETDDGLKLDYNAIIALLVGKVKELQKTVEALDNRVTQLNRDIAGV